LLCIITVLGYIIPSSARAGVNFDKGFQLSELVLVNKKVWAFLFCGVNKRKLGRENMSGLQNLLVIAKCNIDLKSSFFL
jgi:hypothetical protein